MLTMLPSVPLQHKKLNYGKAIIILCEAVKHDITS